jgi:predicted transcriptional regulator of viral defense system
MTAFQAYGRLRAFGRPVIETREAATLLQISPSNASHLLRSMDAAGLTRRIRHGLWAIDTATDPVVIAPYLTVPYPAYVSLWSALAAHDMIEQIPAQIFVVSLDRSRKIDTGFGHYSIHHVAPEVFGGFEGDPEHGYLATAEKALFDTLYVRAPRGGRAYFPELSLPDDFDAGELLRWRDLIPSPKLRTIVARGIERVLTTEQGSSGASLGSGASPVPSRGDPGRPPGRSSPTG